MQKITQKYEALFRWGDDGLLKGGQVQFITFYKDDSGDIPPEPRIGKAIPIDMNGSGGFSLDGLMSEIQVESVAAVNALAQQLSEAREALRVSVAKSEGLEEALANARAKLASFEAKAANSGRA